MRVCQKPTVFVEITNCDAYLLCKSRDRCFLIENTLQKIDNKELRMGHTQYKLTKSKLLIISMIIILSLRSWLLLNAVFEKFEAFFSLNRSVTHLKASLEK